MKQQTVGQIYTKIAIIGLALGIALALLAGCGSTPYYELGVGQSFESGNYHSRVGAPGDKSVFFVELDERCTIAHAALGAELAPIWGIKGLDASFNHTSCINHSPEISNNHFMLKKRGYFK